MGNDVEIGARLSLDTGKSFNNLKELQDYIKETKKALTEAKYGTEEYTTAQTNLDQATKLLSGTTKEHSSHFGELKEKIDKVSPAAGEATKGLGGFNNMLNIIRANPIIAILAILAGLVIGLFEHFKKMEAVSDSMGKAWTVLSSIIGKFVDSVLTPLINGFVWLMDKGTKVVSFFADLLGIQDSKTSEEVGKLAEELDNLEDAEKASSIAIAESNRKLQEAREIASDANIPIKDRIKALQEAAKIEAEELGNVVERNREMSKIKLQLIAEEMDARDELIEKIKEGSLESLKAARAELLEMKNVNKEKIYEIDKMIVAAEDAGAQRAKIDKKTNTQIRSLENEEKAKIKKEGDDRKKQAQEDEKKRLQDMREFRVRLTKMQQQEQLEAMKDGAEKDKQVEKNRYADELQQLKIDIESKKLTKKQANALEQEALKLHKASLKKIEDKYDDEKKKKESEFEKELAAIKADTAILGIMDARKKERAQLEKAYEDKKAQIIEKEKDIIKQKQLLEALAANQKVKRDQLENKFKDEDDKRRQDLEIRQITFQHNRLLAEKQRHFNQERKLLDQRKKMLDDARRKEIEAAAGDALKLAEIDQKYTEQYSQLSDERQKTDDAEKAAKEANMEGLSNALKTFAGIIGEHTAAGKAMAVASATIDTYQGASKALAAGPPPWNYIQAAAVIATGLANVKKILSTQVPGKSSGGSAPSAPAPVVPMKQNSSTSLDQRSMQAIGNATTRAFVLESDISNNQERIRRLNRAARI